MPVLLGGNEMHILSARTGFATDHSTVAYRYTAPDKGTAWRAFWEGLPVERAECVPCDQVLGKG